MKTDVIVIVSKSSGCVLADGYKSLIELNGRPAVSYLIDNLKKCELISRVIAVADSCALDAVAGADKIIESSGTEAEMVVLGVRAADEADRRLLFAGDMPLVSVEAVTDLLKNAPLTDIIYPVVMRPDVEEFYPDRKVAYLKTKEGEVTASSCIISKPQASSEKENKLVSLLNVRKDTSAMLALIGPVVGLKMMFSTLSLREFETYLSASLGMDCRVFITHFPELIFSLDNDNDISIAERELADNLSFFNS